MVELRRQNGEKLQLVMDNDQVVAIRLTNRHGKEVQIGFEAPPASRVLSKDLLEMEISAQ